jgi:hypothetical protein
MVCIGSESGLRNDKIALSIKKQPNFMAKRLLYVKAKGFCGNANYRRNVMETFLKKEKIKFVHRKSSGAN